MGLEKWPNRRKIAQSGHPALVLPDLDYRSKYVIHPTKRGMPYNFYFKKFSPSLMVEAAEAGQTLFRAP